MTDSTIGRDPAARSRATSIFEIIAARTAAGDPLAVATVVRTVGSTPQVVGARLVIDAIPGARPLGTLGGGCVEADAIIAARRALDEGTTSLREYQLTEDLAWNSGLVCGGTMWILAERADTMLRGAGDGALDLLRDAARGGPPVAIVTRLRRASGAMTFLGRTLVLASGEMRGSFGDPVLDERARTLALTQLQNGTSRLAAGEGDDDLLVEPVAGRPRLVVAGGGHVARAIAHQAALLDFDVTVLEDRPEFAGSERFPGATVVLEDVPTAIRSLDCGWHTYLVIATRGHKLDADCLRAAVDTRARYIGVLGSRRKTVLLREMLDEEGVSEERIAAVHSPVGLDLGGRTPPEIALSVLAEIVQERYHGSGQPLRMAPPDTSGSD